MKTPIRFTTWLLIPGLLTAALILPDARLAVVAGVVMWAAGSLIGPLALLYMLAAMSVKKDDPKRQEGLEDMRKNAPGPFAKAMGWAALAASTGLAAYLGLPVTAGFYLCALLWARAAYHVVRFSYEQQAAQP